MTDETRRKIADLLRGFLPWPSVFVSWPVYRIRKIRWSMCVGACGGLGCVEDRVVVVAGGAVIRIKGPPTPESRFLYCHPDQGCAVCLRCWMRAAHPLGARNTLLLCYAASMGIVCGLGAALLAAHLGGLIP